MEEDSRRVRLQRHSQLIVCCKRFIAFLFSHVGLAAMVVAYSILGGFLFMAIESSNAKELKQHFEEKLRQLRNQTTARILSELLTTTDVCAQMKRSSRWNGADEESVNAILKSFQESVLEILALWRIGDTGELPADSIARVVDDDNPWSFAPSLLFAVTVITTIGYGHVAPKTPTGRVVTIVYALVGIPLTFLYLSNIGNFLANCFRLFYRRICCDVCCCQRCARQRQQQVALSRRRRLKTSENTALRERESERESRSVAVRLPRYASLTDLEDVCQLLPRNSSEPEVQLSINDDDDVIELMGRENLACHIGKAASRAPSSSATDSQQMAKSQSTGNLGQLEMVLPIQNIRETDILDDDDDCLSVQKVRSRNFDICFSLDQQNRENLELSRTAEENLGLSSLAFLKETVITQVENKDSINSSSNSANGQKTKAGRRRSRRSRRAAESKEARRGVIMKTRSWNNFDEIPQTHHLDDAAHERKSKSTSKKSETAIGQSQLLQSRSCMRLCSQHPKSEVKVNGTLLPFGAKAKMKRTDDSTAAPTLVVTASPLKPITRGGGGAARARTRGVKKCATFAASDSPSRRQRIRLRRRSLDLGRDDDGPSSFPFASGIPSAAAFRSGGEDSEESFFTACGDSTLDVNAGQKTNGARTPTAVTSSKPFFRTFYDWNGRTRSCHASRGHSGWSHHHHQDGFYGGGEFGPVVESKEHPEKVTVPIYVCLIIISGYIFAGSLLFATWEKWDYITGSYFCFITLSTIGFGDIVPGTQLEDWSSHEKLVLCVLWLAFGLSLLAMCFNLMQEEVKEKCIWLGKKVGLLKEDNADRDLQNSIAV